MKRWLFPILTVAFCISGCTPDTEEAAAPAQTAQTQPVKLSAEQELAQFCRVCVVDEGEKVPEFLPARLNIVRDGKTYKFCRDDCKKKFAANPKRYVLK